MMMGWKHLTQDQQARITRWISENRVDGGPFYLEIHPTNRCTVNCIACCCKDCRQGEVLPWPALEKVLRDAAARNLRFLRLSGGGESLSYPEIDALLDLIGELKLRIADLTTNGTVLERVAEKLVRIGVDIATISLNEADPQRYARMMQTTPAMFDKAVRGVEALCRGRDLAPEGERPKIILQFLLWRENLKHLQELIQFGRSLKVDKIYFKAMDLLPEDQRIPHDQLPWIKSLLGELIENDCRSGRQELLFDFRYNLELNHFVHQERMRWLPEKTEDDPDFTEYQPRIHYCYMGWYGMLVSASGLVYPCCPLYGMPGKEVGNIYKETLEAIWTGKRQRQFRAEMRQLMLAGGDLEYSRRLMRYLEPACIDRLGCQFGYCLCSTDFYKTTAARFDTQTSRLARWSAKTRNTIIRQAHQITSRIKHDY